MSSSRRGSVFSHPPDPAEEARLDLLADEEIESGGGIPHEKVKDWLARRARSEKAEPPQA